MVYKDDYAVINGLVTVNVTDSGESTKLDSVHSIQYPTGFNKDNCVVLSIGIKDTSSSKAIGLGYGTTCTNMNNPSAVVAGTFGKGVLLRDDDLQLRLFFEYGASTSGDRTYQYKIVLMKEPEYIKGVNYTLGDVNEDGKITQTDLALIQKYIQGNQSLTSKQLKAADVNQDGKIDTGDTYKLGQYLNGIIDSL